MLVLAVALLAVPLADQTLKSLLLRTIGARSLSLGALGEVRMQRAPIVLLRVGVRLDVWRVWLAAGGALLVAALAVPLPAWSIGLLLGGSLSHTIETWRRGSVLDYVGLRGWPAFDLADVALVIGAGGTATALAVAAYRMVSS
ncbi:MAG TPA: signal peptidase II [Candidatus Binatia bacterium]|nr:signal peptidase II [Candidatus Binatia bacterium]